MHLRHTKWRSESGVQNMRIVYKHEVLSKALDLFVQIDGLNVKQ